MEDAPFPMAMVLLPAVDKERSFALWVHRILWIADKREPHGTHIAYLSAKDESATFYTSLSVEEVAVLIRNAIRRNG